MDLLSMIDDQLVKFNFKVKDKYDAITKIGQLMFDAKKVDDKKTYIEQVLKRENEHSTGIGMGIAIPHCKDRCVKETSFALVQLKQKINWGSLDEKPVQYVIMLAAPDTADNIHLRMLSTLAVNLMDDVFREHLLKARSILEIKTLFKDIKKEE